MQYINSLRDALNQDLWTYHLAGEDKVLSTQEKVMIVVLAILVSACFTLPYSLLCFPLALYGISFLAREYSYWRGNNHKIDFEEYHKDYQLDQMISKFLVEDHGRKLHLVIGKASNEPLPTSTEDDLWISMDTNGKASPLYPKKIDPERIHLKIDIKNAEELGLLENLFHEVIVHDSFFAEGTQQENPWKIFIPLLNTDDTEARLITKAASGVEETLVKTKELIEIKHFKDVAIYKDAIPHHQNSHSPHSPHPPSYFVMKSPHK